MSILELYLQKLDKEVQEGKAETNEMLNFIANVQADYNTLLIRIEKIEEVLNAKKETKIVGFTIEDKGEEYEEDM
jgi:DNA-binding protein H-NS